MVQPKYDYYFEKTADIRQYIRNKRKAAESISPSDKTIRFLDVWLASRRQAVLKHLNPLQFALDCEVPEDEAIVTFIYAAEVGLLRQRFVLQCDVCKNEMKTGDTMADLHVESGDCSRCGHSKAVPVVFFERIASPNLYAHTILKSDR